MTKMRVYSYEMHSKTNQGEKKTKDPTYPTIGSSSSLSVSAMLNTHHHFPVNNTLPGPHHHRDSHNEFVPISSCKAAYHT